MPRKGKIVKRDVLPDPIYNSKLVTKLINGIMLDGKKVWLKISYIMRLLELMKSLKRTNGSI
jgi:small subunit ribosomal protein S7